MLTKNLFPKYPIFFLAYLFFTVTLFADNELIIEIDNPKFSEKGLSDKIYEIKAKRGLKSNNELELFTVEGKFKSEKNGKWIYMEAEKGNFSQTNNFIKLERNIVFYTNEGEIIKSDQATFDMTNDIIKLSKNVSHESAEGLVISDNTTITNSFNSIVYEGNVVSTFKNQKND